ncbi:MAG TPA: ribokinase [Verrucomicrobiae bacterium]
MSSPRKQVVVIGSANMDLVTRVREFPRPGETIAGSALEQHPGGKGANQAVAAARAGAKVSFIGNIGRGAIGDALVAGLKKERIDLMHLERSRELPAGTAVILLNQRGENQIVVTRSSNDLVSVDQVHEAKKTIQQAGMVLLQLEVPLAAVREAVAIAHKSGVPVMLNPAPIAEALPEVLLEKVDWLTPNERELTVLAKTKVSTKAEIETAARKLLRTGVKNVVVTCGARGACWVSLTGTQWIPAKRVKAVDTVGAGDCFSGTLAAALVHGDEPAGAIRYAVDAATVKVTQKGARG